MELIHKKGKGNFFNPDFSLVAAKKVNAFHKSMPGYKETPLILRKDLAREMGVSIFGVKDESGRFGIQSFKALGGSFAIGRYLQQTLGISDDAFSFVSLQTERAQRLCKTITFATATDGNHGRGIAYMAGLVGAGAVVYLPAGTKPERVKHIQDLGATALVTNVSYDDTVRLCKQDAEKENWVFIQDTDDEAYQDIPKTIMQGYLTMAYEMTAQMDFVPTHLFLQGGVGAMAGAMTGFFRSYFKNDDLAVVIVEPERADCLFQTAKHDDGTLHKASGDLQTMMAGLACGEACGLAWELLAEGADFFLRVPEWTSPLGIKKLFFSQGDDISVVSGESGAVTTGVVYALTTDEKFTELKNRLRLDNQSKIICISTEGDTDKENFKRIIDTK